ncbi:MAG: aldo/keto reductase, partial [Burkholderia sp.]|nr:aldo/keto reductase [Burkholderia sp.]
MTDTIATVVLPDGETIPKLGLGTWEMGERPARRADEIAALRAGIELGMTLVDTAEMYGDGATEALVGEALAGLRDDVFLVSKVYPHHASRRGVVAACDASLKRLRTDRLDLYLLHWRGSVPLEETVEGFETLQRAGKIRHWGVSNFDTADMDELVGEAGGGACATNQILYNIARRGPEFDLLPWLADHRMPAMAYSPVDHGRLPKRSPLDEIARLRGVSVMRVALAWVLAQPGVFAI